MEYISRVKMQTIYVGFKYRLGKCHLQELLNGETMKDNLYHLRCLSIVDVALVLLLWLLVMPSRWIGRMIVGE